MGGSLTARLLGVDDEAWNNPKYVYRGAPVFAILGVFIGNLFGVHLVNAELGEYLIVVLCLVITMVIGFVGLALVDMRD